MWLILLLLIFIMTGCGTSESTSETTDKEDADKLQIGLSFDSFVIERWLRDRDMFVSTAQGLNAEVNVQVAGGEVEEQISQIEYFIQKKMDVIVIIPIDGDALYDVVKEAQAAGISVVCYDRIIENVGADLYITIDNEKVGTLMGESLIQACPDGGNIFAIYGSQTDHNVTEVKKGFTEALKGSNLKIVYSDYCDNWLAELAACQRIVEGTQYMTVYKPIEQEAATAATLAVALAKGEDITSADYDIPVTDTIIDGKKEIPYYKIEPVAVTAKNMDEVIIDSGFHTREDVYLNIKN